MKTPDLSGFKGSDGEKYIAYFLTHNNIPFKQEHSFPDCRNKAPLRFDFYLEDYNLLIEFDGRQHKGELVQFHYKMSRKTQEDRAIQNIFHDGIKKGYTDAKGIKLERIPSENFKHIPYLVAGYLNLEQFLVDGRLYNSKGLVSNPELTS